MIHQPGIPSSSPSSSSLRCPQGSPVRSMVMGPGACSHISVSFVTCTLGTLASRDKQQGPDLTHRAQSTITPTPASPGAPHGPVMVGRAMVSVVGVLKQVNARQGTGEQGHLRSPHHWNQPFGVRSHLKDPDTDISRAVPFPGSGAEQGEAKEEDAARAAKASLEVVSFTPPAHPARPPAFTHPTVHPSCTHCFVSPLLPSVSILPDEFMDGHFGCWARGAPQGPPAQTSTSLGGCCGGHGQRGAPPGHRQPCYPGVAPPAPPFAPLRHPHEFPGSL